MTRGSFSAAAAARGSASSGKQSRTRPRRARAAPHLALLPFPSPRSCRNCSLFSYRKEILSPTRPAHPMLGRGFSHPRRAPAPAQRGFRPDFKAPSSIQQAPVPAGAKVSHLIQGEHPGFHTSCKGNIPVSACRGRAPPQVCFHGLPFPR